MRVDEFTKNWIKNYPNASKEVLDFIGKFKCRNNKHEEDLITNLFESGYCYYFALMLKDAFGGEMMWSKGRSHIVWKDTNGSGLVYDIGGVYYDYDELSSIEDLRDALESYRHRGHDYDVDLDIEEYKSTNNISEGDLNKEVLSIIPDYDRTYDYPNLGDTHRYWGTFKHIKGLSDSRFMSKK